MLPAMSTAASPTGSAPTSATSPSLSMAMPAGSGGQAGGSAAAHSCSTHSRSATGAKGRIRHPMPAILPPAAARLEQYLLGAGDAGRGCRLDGRLDLPQAGVLGERG